MVLERWIHSHLQGIGLLLLRDSNAAVWVYAIIMLPGVIVHEGSHWVVATLLGVRTGKVSVIPERMNDGTIRLGYVDTEKPDFVREALIGAAPLFVGVLIILGVGYGLLGGGPVADAIGRGDLLTAGNSLLAMTRRADFWLLLYLVFTVSNSMFPSASDRRGWLPLLALLAVLAALLVYVGFGSVLWDAFVGPINAGVRALALSFSFTIVLDLACVVVLWIVEQGISRLTGQRVEY